MGCFSSVPSVLANKRNRSEFPRNNRPRFGPQCRMRRVELQFSIDSEQYFYIIVTYKQCLGREQSRLVHV